MSEAEDSRQALELYRRRSPLEMIDAAKAFRRMSDKDRDELLFYMVQHLTMALQQQGGLPAVEFKDVEKFIRGGDA